MGLFVQYMCTVVYEYMIVCTVVGEEYRVH